MSVEERDRYTGHMITGHVWNGIKELNSPVPLLWYLCFLLAFVFSVGYWIYMPAWPSVRSHTQGLSGFDQRDELARQLSAANLDSEQWRERFAKLTFAEASEDKQLMALVSRSGPALFEDNCAGCHGTGGEGAMYFPRLNDSVWLWGADPEKIYQTLKYGINSGHPQSRIAQMPAFGDTGVLDAAQIRDVALYIQSLSISTIGNGSRTTELLSVNRGKRIFSSQCTACHGVDGTGNTLLGAPNLVDAAWIYGWREENLIKTVSQGRAGHMPAWENRIDDVKLRILSLYVLMLSQANDTANDTNDTAAVADR